MENVVIRHPREKTILCIAEGSLEEPGSRYSSVDLQHKALEWRDKKGSSHDPGKYPRAK